MRRSQFGYTILELLFVLALAATLAAWAIPTILAGLDDFRTYGAVRYVTTRLYRARMEALVRTRDAALRITGTTGAYAYAVYVDGNDNGVRSQDIAKGIDRVIHGLERLPDNFPGVDFGTLPGLPGAEGSTPPGPDPIRIGSGGMVTFTPRGTSTPGSLYIKGSRTAQYVVRIYGQTGKIRVLKFDPIRHEWRPL